MVHMDLDILLTARYVLIDDHVIPAGQRRPGHPGKLSGAELVCPAVAQVVLNDTESPTQRVARWGPGPNPP